MPLPTTTAAATAEKAEADLVSCEGADEAALNGGGEAAPAAGGAPPAVSAEAVAACAGSCSDGAAPQPGGASPAIDEAGERTASGNTENGGNEGAPAADVEMQDAADAQTVSKASENVQAPKEDKEGAADANTANKAMENVQVPGEGAASTVAEGGEGSEDVQVVHEEKPGEEVVQRGAGQRRLSQRKALQARAAEELKQGSSEEAMGRLRARLAAHDAQIKEKEGLEASAAGKFEEVNTEVEAAVIESSTAAQAELEACKALRAVEQRQRDMAAKLAAMRDELEKRRDVLVLLEMRHAKRKADEQEAADKRRKIEELEQVLVESKRAAEEIRQREHEAKEAMKKLMKEEKQLQLARLGGFARRYRQKMLTGSGEGAEGAESAASAAETGAAASSSDQPAAPVRVKREIMQAFAPPKDRDMPVMVVVIDDDSQ